MLQVTVSKEHPVYKYDKRFDVMHVHYADRWNSSVIEDYPGILVHYDDTTDDNNDKIITSVNILLGKDNAIFRRWAVSIWNCSCRKCDR